MRSVFAYTSARILMFGCSVILLYVAGARGLLLLFLGLVISALASYILLNRQRTIIADRLNGRLARSARRQLPRSPSSASASRTAPRPRTVPQDDEEAEEPVR